MARQRKDPATDLVATRGLEIVEAIACRLDDDPWPFADEDGSPSVLKKPKGFPDAGSFLARGPDRQRNRLVVYLVTETPTSSYGGKGPSVQTVAAEIAVVLLLPRRNDPGGERARCKAGEWLNAVRMRLLAKGGDGADRHAGWVPAKDDGTLLASRPLSWLGGRLEPFEEDSSYWVWVDRFTAEWTLDSQRFRPS